MLFVIGDWLNKRCCKTTIGRVLQHQYQRLLYDFLRCAVAVGDDVKAFFKIAAINLYACKVIYGNYVAVSIG